MPSQRKIVHHHQHSTWMLTFVLFLGLLVFSSAIEKEQQQQPSLLASSSLSVPSVPSLSQSLLSTNSTPPRDEIYIDDESLEGSGGHGEIHADLEKDPDYSGSGFGPDDEDSLTNHHSTTTHHHSSSSSSSAVRGNTSGGIGSSSNSNTLNNNLQDISKGKDSTRVTEYDIGSGDGDSDDHHDNIDNNNKNNNENDDEDEIVTHHHNIVESYDHDHNKKLYSNNNNNQNNYNDNKKDIVDMSHDNDDKNEEDIYTDVTDPRHDDDDKLANRFGESGKDVLKQSNDIDLDLEHSKNSPTDLITHHSNEGPIIMDAKNQDRTASFFAQPGILAAVIGGAVVGLLCAILVVMFIVYRMRKKDEGSYALDEPKRSPAVNSYAKNANNREFYA